MFEELGTGFTLLAFGDQDAAVRAFEEGAAKRRVPLKVIRDSYADGRTAYEAQLTLVRPDQYVVWCGDRAPGDTAQLMAKVAGQG